MLKVERVESCSEAKESCEVERWQDWPKKWIIYVKKIYNRLAVYNLNSMCLSILHFFFHFTTFWIELKNTNKIFKQLHHCFKSAKKDEITWWLNDKKKLATYIFLLHQFGLPLPYVNFLNSTSCSAIAVGITGLLKQLSFHVPLMHLLVS